MRIRKNALSLVKTIGLPGLVEGEVKPLKETLSLFPLAELNKTPLLYLESLEKQKKYPPLEAQFSHYRNKHGKTLELIILISNLLERSAVCYTIFKTLKPFPYTPADIDVLLWSSRDLTRASQILKKRDLKPLNSDHFGLTMLSIDHDVNVDLTTEVAVSSLIYLHKDSLFGHVHQVKVDGFAVQTLKPYADLITTAGHCMYKEQMYTLSDYYTFALSSQYYEEASKLAKSTHTKFAFETALKLTYDITINAFGSDNNLIERLEKSLKTADITRMIQTGKRLGLPIKYSPRIVLRGLSKKLLEDPVSRNSLPTALLLSIQPKTINRLLAHITRKGY